MIKPCGLVQDYVVLRVAILCVVPLRIRRSPRRSLLPAASLFPPLLPSAIAGKRISTSHLACLHASPRPQHLSHCLICLPRTSLLPNSTWPSLNIYSFSLLLLS
jgi:hypothetical protein